MFRGGFWGSCRVYRVFRGVSGVHVEFIGCLWGFWGSYGVYRVFRVSGVHMEFIGCLGFLGFI